MTKPIRVLIADDHTLVRRGIESVLEEAEGIEVVAEAVDGYDAIGKAKASNPDVVLMDVNMPGCDGVEATRRLHESRPDIRVLMLTISAEKADLLESMRAGARGYILKSDEPDLLIQAVHFVARGGTLVSPAMSEALLREVAPVRPKVSDPPLSAMEEEVLKTLGNGHSDRVIAYRLATTERAVETLRSNICHKLRIANRRDALVTYARQTYGVRPAAAEAASRSKQPPVETPKSPGGQPEEQTGLIEAGRDFEILVRPPTEPRQLLKLHKWLKEEKGAKVWEVTSSFSGETVITLSSTGAVRLSDFVKDLPWVADAEIVANESDTPRRLSVTIRDR